MKYKLLIYSLIAAAISGCSSTYRASQTPDDVYYSPARAASVSRQANNDRYEDYVGSSDDKYLRMKVQDRERWSSIDDYSYWNDSRYVPMYSNNYYMSNGYNSNYYMNNWSSPYYYNPMYSGAYGLYGFYYPQFGYSPYMSSYISKRPVVVSPSVNRPFLGGYSNRNSTNRNAVYNNNVNYNNRNDGYGTSSRRAYTPNNTYSNRNTNNNTYQAPERSYAPARSYSPSPSAGSSGGAVSRPSRH